MPQMNPIWWFSLFLIFLIALTMSNTLNYFYSTHTIKFKTNKTNNKYINWKW